MLFVYCCLYVISIANQFKENPGTNRETPWLWHRRTKCRRWLVMTSRQRSDWLSERFSMLASLENLLVSVCMCALVWDVFICWVEWDMTILHVCPYPQILLRMPPILADRVRFLFTEEEWRMELLWITTHKRWGGPVFGVGRVRRDKLCAQTIWWQPACRAQKGSCPHLPPPRVGKKSI